MEWLQKIYIFFLNPFCRLSEKIESRIKTKLIYVTCFLLYGICYVWYTMVAFDHVPTLLSRMFQGIVLVVILVFLGLDKPLKTVKWNKLFAWVWFLLGAVIFIMGFITEQNPGYWMTGPVIAIGFPCLYMVYGEEKKYMVLFDAFCKAAIIITIIYFFASLVGEFFRPMAWGLDGRYNGIAQDSNRVGELCIMSFSCIMFYFYTSKKNRFWYLAIVSLGIVLGQVYLTQSRTTILAIIAMIIFYFIVFIRDFVKKGKEKKINRIKTIVIFACLAMIIAGITVFITTEVRDHNPNRVLYEEEYRDVLPEGQDLNSYSSGRFKIWGLYADGFNFFGNTRDLEVSISDEIYQVNAHNSLIEITYRSGYIAGLLFLAIEIYVGLFILWVMFRKKNSGYIEGDVLIATNAIGFMLFTNLMPAYNPITAFSFFVFVLTLFPMFIKKGR